MRGDTVHAALWNHDRYKEDRQERIDDVHAVIVGHTPTDEMALLGNVYYIDTYGWAGGKFTLLDVDRLRA